MEPRFPALPLQQVYLGKGGDDWQPAVAASVVRHLPALQHLQFRFSFDDEQPPQASGVIYTCVGMIALHWP